MGPQCSRIRQASRKRRWTGWPTSWGYYSTIVLVLQWGDGRGPGLRRPPADGDGWSCLGLRPPSAKDLIWPAPLSRPLRPPTFLETGGHAVPPAGAAPPAPRLGDGGGSFLTFAGYGGRDKMRLLDGWSCCGQRCPSTEGSVLACAAVPPAHPPTFLETGGLPLYPRREPRVPCTLLWETGEASLSIAGDTLYPRRGLRPLHPAWGMEGAAFSPSAGYGG